jgi:hypothetical protein
MNDSFSIEARAAKAAELYRLGTNKSLDNVQAKPFLLIRKKNGFQNKTKFIFSERCKTVNKENNDLMKSWKVK